MPMSSTSSRSTSSVAATRADAVSRYQLNKAMYEGTRPERVAALNEDRTRFLAGFTLSSAERAALDGPNFHAILTLGGLPNLVYRYYRAHKLPIDDFRDRLAREAAR